MNIADRLRDDLNASLKKGLKDRAGVLRMLLAEVHNKEKEKYGAKAGSLTDDEALAVFQKEAKKRREAIELFRKGGRGDLVEKEESEIKIVEEFLPKAMAKDEVAAVIDKLAAKGLSDFNSLMKEAIKELRGRADGKLVSELVKEKIK